jgi:hypothetical protein
LRAAALRARGGRTTSGAVITNSGIATNKIITPVSILRPFNKMLVNKIFTDSSRACKSKRSRMAISATPNVIVSTVRIRTAWDADRFIIAAEIGFD